MAYSSLWNAPFMGLQIFFWKMVNMGTTFYEIELNDILKISKTDKFMETYLVNKKVLVIFLTTRLYFLIINTIYMCSKTNLWTHESKRAVKKFTSCSKMLEIYTLILNSLETLQLKALLKNLLIRLLIKNSTLYTHKTQFIVIAVFLMASINYTVIRGLENKFSIICHKNKLIVQFMMWYFNTLKK